MLPTTNPFQPNRNRPRPINPTDSAATTGLLSNPNGTYISNPFPTTAQNGAQGAFGAMLPQVNVGGLNTNRPNTPLFNSLASGNLNSPAQSPLFNYLRNTPLNQPAYPDYAQRHPEQSGTGQNLPRPGTQESLALVNQHAQAQEAMLVSTVAAALEAGDFSALSQLPAADLEAMGLGEFAGVGNGGGTQGASESDGDYVARMTGIGTGVDESKDMTPAQLEERYYKNKAIEAEFLRAKRWDAKRKKLITVGQWLKQERSKYNKKGRRKEARRPAPAPGEQTTPQTEQAQYTIQQAGVVNFNTATG